MKLLPGTHPFMLSTGEWWSIGGACRLCGHALLWHAIAPWKCQEPECPCKPAESRRDQKPA